MKHQAKVAAFRAKIHVVMIQLIIDRNIVKSCRLMRLVSQWDMAGLREMARVAKNQLA